MTEIKIVREDKKATEILKAIRLIDDGSKLAPVVHGEWEKTDDDFYMGLTIFKCSVCREEFVFEDMFDIDGLNYRYCPNCGARMDLKG